MCDENKNKGVVGAVPHFTVAGFAKAAPSVVAHPQMAGVNALNLSTCVNASYNTSTNQICFTIPVYGNFCIPSPIPIPVGGSLEACAQSCGSIFPTGVKVTIYLNGSAIYSGTIVGSC